MEILGPDGSLFLEYERAASMAKGLRIEGAYRVGVKDGRPNKLPNRILSHLITSFR